MEKNSRPDGVSGSAEKCHYHDIWSRCVIVHASSKVETNRLKEADEIWYQYKYEAGNA